MAKRCGEFDQKNNKKAKLDDDIEALWGDDIDEDALEDCIRLATQVCQQDKVTCSQLNNVTHLPTYSAFKGRNTLFSSTQVTQLNNISVRPSTSKYVCPNVSKQVTLKRDLEKDIKALQEKYEEKEGEVSILRAQLQKTKSDLQAEQQKLQDEWKQKITHTERQMKTVKSQLEFKNLEIANLKQKVLEITKHNILDTSLSIVHNTTIPNIQEKTDGNDIKILSNVVQPILDSIYPLMGIIPETIFNIPKREQHITETKLARTCRNAIPYLRNQSMPINMAVDKSDININCVYPDILKLMYCPEGEFDNEENIPHINRIVCACEQFMYDLQNFLDQIKTNLRTEDILEADSNYLKSLDSGLDYKGESEKDEIGVKSSVLLNFLGELLPYSKYLQKYICRGNLLDFQENESLRQQFPFQVIREQTTISHYFLSKILDIIRIGGEIRKTSFMSKFLHSTIKLLININKSNNYGFVNDIFCKLVKEIILSRPSIEVVCQITFLFKVASQHSSFVEFLLNKSQNSVTSKKGILYFNQDACRFYIFVMLFDNTVLRLKNESFLLNVCLNLLCFMYNTFKNSHWIYHQDAKKCECISQLYKVEIEIVSRALEKYIEETKKMKLVSSEWSHFFKNPIAAKVLNLMAFNSYELTEKYITVFSQYKEIEKMLQGDDDLIELEKLNITDEIVEIPSSAFANVDF